MIRAAVLIGVAITSNALACPMPIGAILLVSKDTNAPMAYAQMNTPPLSAPFAMTITFCGLSEEAKALEFDAFMPAHRHGMNFTVNMAKVAKNQFEVSNVLFHMPGLWELHVTAEVAEDSYAYAAEVLMR